MQLAVFLRGVNVGGRKLRTAELASTLEEFAVANVGAAGTFAASKAPSVARLRAELLRRVPFATEAIIVPRSELQELLRSSSPIENPQEPGARRSVTFLSGVARSVPPLPLARPPGADWEVRLLSFRPPFVIGEHIRRRPDRITYPNEVVEREFGVPATTRWWETLEQVEAAFWPTREGPDPGDTASARRRPGRRPGLTGSPGATPRDRARSGRRTSRQNA
jgi:uncharacterized protein (DUF1697 family)